ncbi:hypothetical protein DESA109040_11390 [Deinococcus saxicola]|uniref:hypothetical protein n=1 Tax=Deinococcus saxicola TaxID=249406 RepID=UPI0039EDFD47
MTQLSQTAAAPLAVPSAAPASSPFVALRLAQAAVIAWLLGAAALAANPPATSATATPQGLLTQTDASATTFCSYVKVLPDSKWIKAFALLFFIGGVGMMIFGIRGGGGPLIKAIAALVLIPSVIAVAGAFGIVC